MRADGEQDFRVLHDVRNPHHRNGEKPDQGDGAKEFANPCRASFLHPKQQKQNDQRERYHPFFEIG